jgi:hypothetical protein
VQVAGDERASPESLSDNSCPGGQGACAGVTLLRAGVTSRLSSHVVQEPARSHRRSRPTSGLDQIQRSLDGRRARVSRSGLRKARADRVRLELSEGSVYALPGFRSMRKEECAARRSTGADTYQTERVPAG